MNEMQEVVKLAVDSYKGKVEKYSAGQTQEVLRQALVDANGGSTVLDYKKIRDGECKGLFTLIEEILSRTVIEGLQGDEYFNALVDLRNVAEGDQNIFVVEDNTLFVVAEAADGTQGIRRQRLGGQSETSIPTSLKVVRIYEELNRVLSGRVDFNVFIDKVAESFKQELLNDIYALWSGASDSFVVDNHTPVAADKNFDSEEVRRIIDRMRQNSLAWFTAGSNRATLEGDNASLATRLETLFGEELTSRNGNWYRANGDLLYSVDKDTVARNIVAAMKSNSAQWASVSGNARTALEQENNQYGIMLGQLLSKKVWKDNDGVWWIDNLSRRRDNNGHTYHTGGT